MNRPGKLFVLGVLMLIPAGICPSLASQEDSGWVSLFDGKTLGGWTTVDGTAGAWTVEDGSITCSGPASHLFSPRGDYKNFRYRAEIKINDTGNSGMYFRTKKEPGFPRSVKHPQLQGTKPAKRQVTNRKVASARSVCREEVFFGRTQ